MLIRVPRSHRELLRLTSAKSLAEIGIAYLFFTGKFLAFFPTLLALASSPWRALAHLTPWKYVYESTR